MTRFFFYNNVFDKADDLCTTDAAADKVAQVVFGGREQAGADLTVGSEADARAGAAEHLRHGCDDADLARRSVGKRVFPRSLAAA